MKQLASIFETITNTARISENGGGAGANVSQIRATGSWVMGKANASGGVIPWIKLLDVPEFLECQTENDDRRRKAYDIFPQLVISDEFMRRAAAQED